jgi:hypothetical protein
MDRITEGSEGNTPSEENKLVFLTELNVEHGLSGRWILIKNLDIQHKMRKLRICPDPRGGRNEPLTFQTRSLPAVKHKHHQNLIVASAERDKQPKADSQPGYSQQGDEKSI